MSKRASETLIWSRPEAGRRAGRLNRETISAAALSIADSEGFEAVSMRRIAARLGASTMSLYHYVHTKTDLTALMDDALMAEILVPEGELPAEWRAAITAVAYRTRDVYARHPWALLSMRGAPPGPNAMRHFEQSLEALADAPMDLEGKLTLLQLVDDFVIGHSLRAAEAAAWSSDSAVARSVEKFGLQLLGTGRFPHAAALLGGTNARELARRRRSLTQDRFAESLEVLLDGAAQRLRASSRARRASRRGRS